MRLKFLRVHALDHDRTGTTSPSCLLPPTLLCLSALALRRLLDTHDLTLSDSLVWYNSFCEVLPDMTSLPSSGQRPGLENRGAARCRDGEPSRSEGQRQ
jgi:hypothetical protein